MREELSIVIIGRNEEAAIRNCVEAALYAAAEIGGAEIVFVDSHSSDNTVREVQQCGVKFQILDKKVRPSPSAARYFGTGQVKGDYVLFLDADTIIYKGFLPVALEQFRTDPKLAGINGWIEDTTEAGEPVHGVEERCETAADVKWLRGPCCLYRRSALLAVGGFDPDLATEEEAELGLRIVRAGWKLKVIPRPMARHTRCYHPTSLNSLVATFVRDLGYGRLGEITRTILHASRAGNGTAFCWLRLKTTILFLIWGAAIVIMALVPQQPIGRILAIAITAAGALALAVKKRNFSQAILFVPSKVTNIVDLLVGVFKFSSISAVPRAVYQRDQRRRYGRP